MFEVYASIDSLLPRIWAVDAVGMGANSNELRTPYLAIFSFRAAQSHRSVGVTPHISYCNTWMPTNIQYRFQKLFFLKTK